MTFEEWWYAEKGAMPEGYRAVFREAWQAATRAERERCAEKCDKRAKRAAERETVAQNNNFPLAALVAKHDKKEARGCAGGIREGGDGD